MKFRSFSDPLKNAVYQQDFTNAIPLFQMFAPLHERDNIVVGAGGGDVAVPVPPPGVAQVAAGLRGAGIAALHAHARAS